MWFVRIVAPGAGNAGSGVSPERYGTVLTGRCRALCGRWTSKTTSPGDVRQASRPRHRRFGTSALRRGGLQGCMPHSPSSFSHVCDLICAMECSCESSFFSHAAKLPVPQICGDKDCEEEGRNSRSTIIDYSTSGNCLFGIT